MGVEIQTLQLKDPSFPAAVRDLPAPPPTIYLRGDLRAVTNRPALGIVGTRRPTAYGRSVTLAFTATAAKQGFVIISGLAFGIDSLAHQAALDAGGLTVAVLGSGLDNITPRSNHQLADQIVASGGALFSHYPPGQPAGRHTFVARNYLIAALSDYLLIPEAAIDSGSRHTAAAMAELGKPVLAVPGSINWPMSAGPNRHIRDGALAVTSTAELLSALDSHHQPDQTRLFDSQTPAERHILGQLQACRQTLHQLLAGSQMPLAELQSGLSNLEIAGAIIRRPGGYWELSHQLDSSTGKG